MTRKYRTFNYPNQQSGGAMSLTGIRAVKGSDREIYITGWYRPPGDGLEQPFIYKGRISGKGIFHPLSYPSSSGVTVTHTNWYGPNNGKSDNIQVVGSYATEETGSASLGALYIGPIDGSGMFRTLKPTSDIQVSNTIAHSTMGGLVVGNYDTDTVIGNAFIYDIKEDIYYNITREGAKSLTSYGIWHNKGHSYTICGGYSNATPETGPDSGYLVDWNSQEKTFSNWRIYSYNNDSKTLVTHFDGITGDCEGGYNITGTGAAPTELAFFANISKKKDPTWEQIQFEDYVTTGNSVCAGVVIGIYITQDGINGYISY